MEKVRVRRIKSILVRIGRGRQARVVRWIAVFGVLLIIASYFCYKGLGTDLLPEMDEGGFVVDYLMPPGS